MEINKIDSLLLTTRNLKATFYVTFSGLLGTLFGLLGSFGTCLGFTEKQIERIQKKCFKSLALIEAIQRRHNIFTGFKYTNSSEPIQKNFSSETNETSSNVNNGQRYLPNKFS